MSKGKKRINNKNWKEKSKKKRQALEEQAKEMSENEKSQVIV